MRCNAEECQYHQLTGAAIQDMRETVKALVEGQQQMRDNLIQLTEAFKQMDRLERRVDKMEERGEKDNKEQDVSIRKLENNFYKAAGGIGAVLVVAQILLKVFFGV